MRLQQLVLTWITLTAVGLAQAPHHTEFEVSGKMARHVVPLMGDRLDIVLDGMPSGTDWALGIHTSDKKVAAMAATEVEYAAACCGGMTPISRMTDLAVDVAHTTGSIVVSLNGVAKGHSVMLYLEAPTNTTVTLLADSGVLFHGAASNAVIRNGAVISTEISGPHHVMSALMGMNKTPMPDMTVSPKGDGKYIAASKNVLAHAQNPATITGATGDGNVRVMLEIDPTGHVTNVRTAQSGPPELESLVAQAARQWTFNPFMEGGTARTVIGSVLIVFRNGVGVWQ